jgi:hypothetical protein
MYRGCTYLFLNNQDIIIAIIIAIIIIVISLSSPSSSPSLSSYYYYCHHHHHIGYKIESGKQEDINVSEKNDKNGDDDKIIAIESIIEKINDIIDVNIETKITDIIDVKIIDKIDEINDIMNTEEINIEKITGKIEEISDEKTENETEKIDEILDEKTEIVEVINIDNMDVKTVDEISSDIVLHENGENALVVATESSIGMYIYVNIYIYMHI